MELVDEVFDKIAKEFIFSEEDIKHEKDFQEVFNKFVCNRNENKKSIEEELNCVYIPECNFLSHECDYPIIFEKSRKYDGLFRRGNERVYIELKPYNNKKGNKNAFKEVLRDAIFQSLLYTLYGDRAIAVIGMGNGEIQKYINDENEYIIKNACNKLGLRIILKTPNNKFTYKPNTDDNNKNSEQNIGQEAPKEVKQKIGRILDEIKKNDFSDYKKIKGDNVHKIFKRIFPEVEFNNKNRKTIKCKSSNESKFQIRYGVVNQNSSGNIGDQSLAWNLLDSLKAKGGEKKYSITVVLLPKKTIKIGKIYIGEDVEKDPVQDLVDKVWQNTGACWIFKGVWQFKNSDKQIKKLWAPSKF